MRHGKKLVSFATLIAASLSPFQLVSVQGDCVDCSGSDKFCGTDDVCYDKFVTGDDISSITFDGSTTTLLSDGNTAGSGESATGGNVEIVMNFVASRFVQYCRIYTTLTNDGGSGFVNADYDSIGFGGNVDDYIQTESTIKELTTAIIFGTRDESYTMYEFECFGAESTREPTSSPTLDPTPATNAPSIPPTQNPTLSPTMQPTDYPTINTCEEMMITQECCGSKGYYVRQEKENIRDPGNDDCLYITEMECCGDDKTRVRGTSGDSGVTFSSYDCRDAGSGIEVCDGSEFEVTRPNLNWTWVNSSDPNVPYTDAAGGAFSNPDYCDCNYTFNTCEGADIAQCGTSADYKKFNDSFPNEYDWYNISQWYGVTDAMDDLASIGYGGDNVTYFNWESCSEDAFDGEVDSIDYISPLDIDNGTCKCQYNITVCGVTPNEERSANSPNEDEEIRDCCNGGEVVIEYSTALRSVTGSYCADTPDVDELCPGIPDSQFDVSVGERKLRYWAVYNENTDERSYEIRCQCRYYVNTTVSVSSRPTTQPTKAPSTMDERDSPDTPGGMETTEDLADDDDDDDDDGDKKNENTFVPGVNNNYLYAAGGGLVIILLCVGVGCYYATRNKDEITTKATMKQYKNYQASDAAIKRAQTATGKNYQSQQTMTSPASAVPAGEVQMSPQPAVSQPVAKPVAQARPPPAQVRPPSPQPGAQPGARADYVSSVSPPAPARPVAAPVVAQQQPAYGVSAEEPSFSYDDIDGL